MSDKFTNALANETSPYLLQHAHNPVNWQPWGATALEQARREDKPIFLSIGYAACHWCHVMEHESFEDEEVAGILNENYVSIKVDREERPDLDEIYMSATMMFSGGHGGWPMSVFLAPDLTPFFAGTYFPKDSLYGRPGFKSVLTQLLNAWRGRRDEIESNRPKVIAALQQIHSADGDGDLLSRERVTEAAEAVRRAFEPSHGGLPSGTNKFPPSQAMDLLLREYSESGYAPCLSAVELTLEKMAQGGIYDHLGGGIARYSTDLKWLVPHFEKMLYDQALVSAIYLDGYQVTGNVDLKRLCASTARGIFEYVLRDLTSPEGAFYSSEDADSEGLEGKFYIWTLEDVIEILGDADGAIFASHYDVTEYGNWDHPGDDHVPHGPKNILHVSRSAETIAKLNGVDPGRVSQVLSEGRKKLFEAREERVRPGLDDKVLTGWNGLMISSLSKGAAVLDERRFGEAAARAADFILRELRSEGRLLATYGKGRARLSAYSTDYAFFIDGLLGLYEWDGSSRWLDAAEELLDTAIEHYWEESPGGFYFTAGDHEELLIRSKTANDGAIPSANSVMLTNLQRLAILLDRGDLRDKAAAIIRVFGAGTGRAPFQHERLLCGIQAWHQGYVEIALVGDPDDERTKALERAVYGIYLPNKVVAKLDPASPQARELPLLANRGLVDGRPAAYVCRNYTCQQPVTEPEELRNQLIQSSTAIAAVEK